MGEGVAGGGSERSHDNEDTKTARRFQVDPPRIGRLDRSRRPCRSCLENRNTGGAGEYEFLPASPGSDRLMLPPALRAAPVPLPPRPPPFRAPNAPYTERALCRVESS